MLWVLRVSPHSICFCGEIWIIIPKLSPNTLLICFSVMFVVLYQFDAGQSSRYPVELVEGRLVGMHSLGTMSWTVGQIRRVFRDN